MRPVDRPIRIASVVARLNVGGPAIHLVTVNTRLDPARFSDCIVHGTEGPSEGSLVAWAREKGARTLRIPALRGEASFGPRDLAAFRELLGLFRRERPDIVHTHAGKAGILGRLAARAAGVPVVLHTYHGHVLHSYYGRAKSSCARAIERFLARSTDRLVAVSEAVKRELVALGVAAEDRFVVVPVAVDLEGFAAPRERGALRRELGLDGAPLIGIVGRIVPVKDHGLFLAAAARIVRELPQARFLVVGDGTGRPGAEAAARRLGLADRVSFLGWRSDLPRIYADLDVLAVCSRNEGTPLAALEAMAAGCPVVATRVGGLPDVISDGETGLLVEAGDAAGLAGAVVRLLREPSTARAIRQAARRAVLERYHPNRTVGLLERLYEGTLRRGAAEASLDTLAKEKAFPCAS
jgi:glycosyltransferase involved in cell wall biosynthesis